MSDDTQSAPIMDGSTEATGKDRLAGLIEQVEQDHGDEGAGAMADHLRDRVAETEGVSEDSGDVED